MNHANPYQDPEGPGLLTDMAIVARLTAVIEKSPLDCECKPKLDKTLAHFTALVPRLFRDTLAHAPFTQLMSPA